MGYGEAGLPPKKAHIYLADFSDVTFYVSKFSQYFETLLQSTKAEDEEYCPFQNVPTKYFSVLRRTHTEIEPTSITILRILFKALDSCPENKDKSSRPARNAVEMALLDLWGKFLSQPLYKMIGIANHKKPCFYTIGLDKIDNMLKSLQFGLKNTKFLKIKLNRDYTLGSYLLKEIIKVLLEKEETFKLVIDANSDWDIETTEKYFEILKDYKNYIYMIEQPFPVEILDEDRASWETLKNKFYSEGLLICADESIRTSCSISNIRALCHVVNIKLDKAGGIREALRAVEVAEKANLQVWFGQMVSSSLSTLAAASLLPLAHYGGDLDGSLLVTPESDLFISSLIWDNNTGHVCLSDQFPGVGVKVKG